MRAVYVVLAVVLAVVALVAALLPYFQPRPPPTPHTPYYPTPTPQDTWPTPTSTPTPQVTQWPQESIPYEARFSVRGHVKIERIVADYTGWVIYGEGPLGSYMIMRLEAPAIGYYYSARGVAHGTAIYTEECTPEGCRLTVSPLYVSIDKFLRDKTTPVGQCSHLGYAGTLRSERGVGDASEIPLAILPGRVRYTVTMCEYRNILLQFTLSLEYIDQNVTFVVDVYAESIGPYDEAKYREIYAAVRR